MGDAVNHQCYHEQEITLLVDRTKDIGRDVKDLMDSIKGNGKPGLATNMALQKQCVERLHERVDELHESMEKICDRAAICESNDTQIQRIWKVLMWIGSPMVAGVVGILLKLAFFTGG